MGAIFLSASVPTREPYSLDCRPQEIQAAINALAQVVLGRRKLVWGGHPAITPLLWSAAQAVGVEYTVAVELFQSRLFTKVLPPENKYFANVRLIDAVGEDQEASLRREEIILNGDGAISLGMSNRLNLSDRIQFTSEYMGAQARSAPRSQTLAGIKTF